MASDSAPFTLDAARSLLERVRAEASLLHRLFIELEYRRPRDPVSDSRVDPLYFTMTRRLTRGLSALEAEGLCVDDLRHGMLDFPARLDDRPVMLCWRVGEPNLRFWRESGQGQQRWPLPRTAPAPEARRPDFTVLNSKF